MVVKCCGAFRMYQQWGQEVWGSKTPVGLRRKVPLGGVVNKVSQKLKLIVNKCLNFNVLEEQN